jgi:tRNA-(ms[2]io[6]A)-hydroxylase
MSVDITELQSFLPCPTPVAWLNWALENPDIMLVDHANCEKKAASSALNMLYRYVDHERLLHKLSRLAREELRHFEQVIAIMKRRNIAYTQLSAARYAGGLRECARRDEPGRLVDTLIIGALIEARSCERFAALAPLLDGELGQFYLSLLKSEARHFQDYLKLAEAFAGEREVEERLAEILPVERELIESEDTEFRFHSGVPGTH